LLEVLMIRAGCAWSNATWTASQEDDVSTEDDVQTSGVTIGHEDDGSADIVTPDGVNVKRN
jgi:hypothetical protein